MKIRLYGYCSYSPSSIGTGGHTGDTIFNNEKWYYKDVPFGWNDGRPVDTIENCKLVEGMTSYEEAANFILNDTFHMNQ